MDKDISSLSSIAMSLLMEREASNKRFFTQQEFVNNMGIIFAITSARNNLQTKINKDTTL